MKSEEVSEWRMSELLTYLREAIPANKIVTIPESCNISDRRNGMYTTHAKTATGATT